MNASSTPEPTVYLVALDGAPSAEHVLDVACGLGAAFAGAAELHILHVVGVVPAAVSVAPALVAPTDMLEGGKVLLDRMTARATSRFQGRISGHLGAGEPWREIVQMASNVQADLVVVGTAGRTGIARVALGSVAEQVVRHAGCPVLVVRPKNYHVGDGETIEPACPDCLATQKATKRATLWCERHSAHHPHGRLHYSLPPTFGVGSMNFRP